MKLAMIKSKSLNPMVDCFVQEGKVIRCDPLHLILLVSFTGQISRSSKPNEILFPTDLGRKKTVLLTSTLSGKRGVNFQLIHSSLERHLPLSILFVRKFFILFEIVTHYFGKNFTQFFGNC